jgi:hypothetical protein
VDWGSRVDHVGGRSKELISDLDNGGSKGRGSKIYTYQKLKDGSSYIVNINCIYLPMHSPRGEDFNWSNSIFWKAAIVIINIRRRYVVEDFIFLQKVCLYIYFFKTRWSCKSLGCIDQSPIGCIKYNILYYMLLKIYPLKRCHMSFSGFHKGNRNPKTSK